MLQSLVDAVTLLKIYYMYMYMYYMNLYRHVILGGSTFNVSHTDCLVVYLFVHVHVVFISSKTVITVSNQGYLKNPSLHYQGPTYHTLLTLTTRLCRTPVSFYSWHYRGGLLNIHVHVYR